MSEQMSDNKHTSGPWTSKRTKTYDAVYGPQGELITFVAIREDEEAVANNALISASPDMLAALEVARQEIIDLCESSTLVAVKAKRRPAYMQIEATLQKAKGEL
jgi:hypothetical protein